MNQLLPPIPLSLAGSDPTGGAGIEADLKVMFAHGFSGAAVITTLTTQDSRGVEGVTPVPAADIERRLELLLEDLPVGGIKIGLLPDCAATLRRIAALLREARLPVVILDPIVAPTYGPPFLNHDARSCLMSELLPLTTLVTPNLDEATLLVGILPGERPTPADVIEALRDAGATGVLLKGGHGAGEEAVDLFADQVSLYPLRAARLRHGAHGTGCALSSAILCNQLLGYAPLDAATRAKRYVHRALQGATAAGRGQRLLRFDVSID